MLAIVNIASNIIQMDATKLSRWRDRLRSSPADMYRERDVIEALGVAHERLLTALNIIQRAQQNLTANGWSKTVEVAREDGLEPARNPAEPGA